MSPCWTSSTVLIWMGHQGRRSTGRAAAAFGRLCPIHIEQLGALPLWERPPAALWRRSRQEPAVQNGCLQSEIPLIRSRVTDMGLYNGKRGRRLYASPRQVTQIAKGGVVYRLVQEPRRVIDLHISGNALPVARIFHAAAQDPALIASYVIRTAGCFDAPPTTSTVRDSLARLRWRQRTHPQALAACYLLLPFSAPGLQSVRR